MIDSEKNKTEEFLEIGPYEANYLREQFIELSNWKDRVTPYLNDYIKLMELVGNYSTIASLKLFISK